MRRSFPLVLLSAIGCAAAPDPDTIAAQDLIRSRCRAAEMPS